MTHTSLPGSANPEGELIPSSIVPESEWFPRSLSALPDLWVTSSTPSLPSCRGFGDTRGSTGYPLWRVVAAPTAPSQDLQERPPRLGTGEEGGSCQLRNGSEAAYVHSTHTSSARPLSFSSIVHSTQRERVAEYDMLL